MACDEKKKKKHKVLNLHIIITPSSVKKEPFKMQISFSDNRARSAHCVFLVERCLLFEYFA